MTLFFMHKICEHLIHHYTDSFFFFIKSNAFHVGTNTDLAWIPIVGKKANCGGDVGNDKVEGKQVVTARDVVNGAQVEDEDADGYH